MLLKTFLYIAFVDEFLEAASEQVFGGFDLLINSFLKNREFIREKKILFQFSIIPFLISQIQMETNIEALYIKLNIFTEVFYGVYGDEDNSEAEEDETSLTSNLTASQEALKQVLASQIYRMCFDLMKNPDTQVFAFCSKLMRQLFQRIIYKLENESALELMEVLCEKILNDSNYKSIDTDEDNPEVLSVNMFGLIFYALAQDSELVYRLININILTKIYDVLQEYDNGEPIDEVFGVLNLIVEILYKFAKTESLDKVIAFSSNLLSDLLSYFLALKDIASFGEIYVDEVMNIIYYISRIIKFGKQHPKLSLDQTVDLSTFDWELLTILDQKLEKSVVKTRKKIKKLRRMLK